jgi:Ala-tRNA(Pro) deacylase
LTVLTKNRYHSNGREAERIQSQEIIEELQSLDISFLTHTHPPLYTVEEAKLYDEKMPGGHCKNMLLTNKKRSAYYLFILQADKRMNFKRLGDIIGVKGLKFAKEETLERFDTFSGSVSPFIILEDVQGEIAVYLDRSLLSYDRLNFHPNINTMTLGIMTPHFMTYMKQKNHDIQVFDYE